MSKYFDEYDKKIFLMMNTKEWWIDKFKSRKIELLRPARRVHFNSSISQKMGAMLIWQQVIEQFLKEIIQISISYIKAEIWPTKVDLKVDLNEKTFGCIINSYDTFSIDFKDKQYIIDILKKINKNRNKIVHRIFEIEQLEGLEEYFKYNFNNYQSLLELLIDHYIYICHLLEDLKERVNWEDFLEEIND